MGALRSRWHTPAALALLAAIVFASAPEGSAQDNQGTYKLGSAKQVDVRVTGVFAELPPTGHYPIRFEIKNASSTAFEAQVRVSAQSGYHSHESSFSSNFAFKVGAGEAAVHTVVAPLPPPEPGRHHSGGANLSWRMTHNMAGESPARSVGSNIDRDHPAVGYGTAAGNVVRGRVGASLRRSSGRSSGGSDGTNFDPRHLPADPLALSGMDLLVFTESDWADVAEASRGAVLDWVRLGGAAVIYPEAEGRTLAGMGVKLPPGTADAKEVELGLGKVLLAPPFDVGRPASVNASAPKTALTGKATRVARYSNDYSGVWPAGDKLGERRFATTQVVIILLVFGILVGPVNLFVWAKPGKRHRLFITTPLISLAASLLLAGLIVVQDGFGGKGSRHILVYADPDTNRAYVLQEQASRTGVLFGSTFAPNQNSLAVPLRWGSGAGGRSDERTVLRRNGDTLSGDWFSSRSDQAQYLEAVVPSRGGVEVTGGGGAPSAVSSFDFPLAELVYVADGDPASYWRATGEVGTGAAVKLQPMSREDFAAWWIAQEEQFSAGIRARLTLGRMVGQRGVYFATAKDPGELAIETLGSIRWRENHTLIHGRAVKR